MAKERSGLAIGLNRGHVRLPHPQRRTRPEQAGTEKGGLTD